MKLILNNFERSTGFQQALRELIRGADTLSVAVSYLQVGGWEMFHKHVERLSLPRMRIVCTDQLGITHPEAVKRALNKQVRVRNFAREITYHPKVFLAHDANGRATRFLLGSANLSASAFSDSVEVGVLGEEARPVRTLDRWFDNLFNRHSVDFTADLLAEMDQKWREQAAQRAKNRLRRLRDIGVKPDVAPPEPEDIDTLDDVLATIRLPIGLLNIDYGGNNVRNIDHLRRLLSTPRERLDQKQKSELKLLGFAFPYGELTALGREAAASRTNMDVARLWCRWLKRTPNAELEKIHPRLLVAKRVFPQFWRLRPEVRNHFLDNVQNRDERRTLQTIELLCNANALVQELSLDDMRTLSGLLNSDRVPDYIKKEVGEYFDNKGQRSWDGDDRREIPLAWREA